MIDHHSHLKLFLSSGLQCSTLDDATLVEELDGMMCLLHVSFLIVDAVHESVNFPKYFSLMLMQSLPLVLPRARREPAVQLVPCSFPVLVLYFGV